MTRRRRILVAAAAVLGAAGATLLLAREVRLPGTSGASRIAGGFRPGRWDARFLVARGPASIELPREALRVTLVVSGPATAAARYEGGQVEQKLTDRIAPWTLELPAGGPLRLEADGAVRLFEVRIERLGRAPSLSFARLVGLAAWHRTRRPFVLGVLLLAIVAVLLAARTRPLTAASPVLPAIVGGLLALSCALQVTLRPQPRIIGDPGAYWDMGARFRDALRAPAAFDDALLDLRPYGGLAFTGTLYGTLRLVRDAPSTIYLAHALALGGAAFFLVRAAGRIGGRRLSVVTGVVASTYATFPVICGIVQPEPFILLLWCFAFDRLTAVVSGDPPRRLVAAGFAFTLGLALHPQGIWYLLAAAILLMAPFAAVLRRPQVRAGALAFALGVAPVAAATAVGESYARPAVHVLDTRYGFFAYTSQYPLGFWLFLDTDGWQGPVRLDQTRYAMELDAEREEGPVSGLAFTARFVSRNALASLRAVLRNLHRLYRFPDNPFHRAWLLPFGLQVAWHQVIVVAFLLSVPLLFRSRAAIVLLPVAMLAATYPLYHVFNKYALPATPFLILGASLVFLRLFDERPRLVIAALVVAFVVAFPRPATLVFAGVVNAAVARWSLLALLAVAVLAAFAWTIPRWGEDRVARGVAVLAFLALAAARVGAEWDDPAWRAFESAPGVASRQEIDLDDAALALVRHARESYLALDLRLADGDPSAVRLEFASGLVVPGAELQPTMPVFGLATMRGDRDPRRFAQWWVTPWRAEMMQEGRLAVTVRGGPSDHLRGDVGPDPEGSHHGVSLGQWPLTSVYRLMHEGEYRLPVDQPIDRSVRRSWTWWGDVFEGTWGIRLVALDDEAGGAEWETEAAPRGEVVTAVWARAGRGTPAELVSPAGSVRFELGGAGPWRGPGGELRYVPTGEYEGWYLLRTSIDRAGPLTLRVRPRQQMLVAPKYFLPEMRPAPPVPAEWTGLPRVAAASLAWAREAPAWRPIAIY